MTSAVRLNISDEEQMISVTIAELKEILAQHQLWPTSEDGKRADLRGADLREADLSGANLREADLSGANLREADLRRANLSGANLRGANLIGANLREANLSEADLREADLSGANLREADLSGANLRGANLRRANLSEADPRGADLRGADLSGANLSGANLILIGQDIRGYLFWAFQNSAGVVVARAGCRNYTGIGAAEAHWAASHLNDEILHADCLSLVARCKAMALARGWKLEGGS